MALQWQVSSYGNLSEKNLELLELMYPHGAPIQETDIEGDIERHYLEDFVYSYDQAMTDPADVVPLFAALALVTPLKLEEMQVHLYESLKALIVGERTSAFPESLPDPKTMYFYDDRQFATWKEDFLATPRADLEDSAESRIGSSAVQGWLKRQESGYRKRMSVYMFYRVE